MKFKLIILFALSNFTLIFAQPGNGVVVNELMSSNDSAVSDADGDFDDWIEIYNNAETSFDLSGYGLSDDIEELGKYKFPEGTIIEGEGYLIVWADDDQEQGPLHAQFKLSGSGEAVYLTDINDAIIDQIVFGEIPTDFSFAREPNGTGDFVIKGHTFGANNNTVSATKESIPSTVKIFPNPSQDYIQIELAQLQGTDKVQLIDMQGKIIVDIDNPFGSVQIDIATLVPGNYFLRIDDYKSMLIQKMQ